MLNPFVWFMLISILFIVLIVIIVIVVKSLIKRDEAKSKEVRYENDKVITLIKAKKLEDEFISLYKSNFCDELSDKEILESDLELKFFDYLFNEIDTFTSNNFKALSRDYNLNYNVDSYGIIDSGKWDSILEKIITNIIIVKIDDFKKSFSELFMLKNRIKYILISDYTGKESFNHWYNTRVIPILKDELQNSFISLYEIRSSDNLKDIENISNGLEYEQAISSLINKSDIGWTANVSKASGDQGLDIFVEHHSGITIAIQTKCYSGTVGNKAVQEVLGAAAFYDTDIAMVVINSNFTKSAQSLAQSSGVILIHHKSLILELTKLAKGL